MDMEKGETISREWEFHADLNLPYDPLLNCLLVIAKLNNKTFSAESLTAGLPLVNHRLTPDLFIYAAEHAGLTAKIYQKRLIEIDLKQLPLVLFLKNMDAAVLTKIEGGFATIIRAETSSEERIALEELHEQYLGYAIFVKPSYEYAAKEPEAQKVRSSNWLWTVIKRAFPIYNEVFLASFFINLFTIASPLFVMNVYDRVVPNAAIMTLWVLAIGVMIVFAFDFILRNLRAYFIDYAGRRIDIQLSNQTFEQVMGLEMGVRPTTIGSLANTIHSFEAFRDFITSATVSLLVDIPFVVIFLIVIAFLGGSIVFVPIVVIPIVLLVNYLVHVPLKNLVQASHQHAAAKQAILYETLAGAETIKGMRAEGIMQSKWNYLIRNMAKLGVKLRAYGNISLNFSQLVQHLAVVFVVVVGVYKIEARELTIGGLIACVILVGRTLAPISQVAALLTRYKQSRASLDSIDQVMQMPTERSQEKTFLHRPTLRGELEFNDVTFAYPNQQINALDHVSFKIKPGEHVGIIGRTGSGKSTIERLMLKLYEPTSGSILIDGTDMRQIDPAELRHNIGYVPQDVVLFNGTIRDNIVIGAPYVDDRAVLRASELSGVDIFVNKHPDGYDRMVYERGQNLSAGQRQAVAIARASIFDPPILIFDEPLNSVDDTSIRHFFDQLTKQIERKTLVLVTHRGSLLKLVNRLIVVDAGKIIIDGPKDEILKKLAQMAGNVKGSKNDKG